MRILFVAPTSFFADYGCHVRILQQARAARTLGHQVLLCTYRTGRDWPGLTIRRTPAIPWRRGLEVGSSWHKLAYDALLAPVCLKAVRGFRPHLIHAFLHEGALLGWLLRAVTGIPLVFDFQGSLTSEMVDHGFLAPRSPLFRPLLWLETFLDRQ
ncbi:MAG: glycosyltransferase, partial [Anaerolineae bacterium]|nr:glycosyltransferase [Anaerolineae bacterium]